MEQIVLLLKDKHSEMKEEQEHGLRVFKECLSKQQERENNEEMEEENENEDKEDLEVEFEEGINLEEKKDEEEWDELDENDYNQLIDQQRFKEIEDTSVF